MSLVPPFSWFANLRLQRTRAAAPTDFADMGTAFGLDASLDSEPPSTMPAVFIRNGRPSEGAPENGLTERRVSPVDLREGQHIDRRSRL